jgi:hypothetical protein
MTDAIEEIRAERERQQSVEGWSWEHDDTHSGFELARAAACYAVHAGLSDESRKIIGMKWPDVWPFYACLWKPKDRRHDLVRAGALIVAEIERLDRLALNTEQETQLIAEGAVQPREKQHD